MNQITKVDWKPVRDALLKGREAWIELCIALVKVSEQGATQEQMAQECGIDQQRVEECLLVGQNRITAIAVHQLPKAKRVIIETARLDRSGKLSKEDFKRLASPSATLKDVDEVKRRLAPPPEPIREAPGKPVVPPRITPATPPQATPPEDSQPSRKMTEEEVQETLRWEREQSQTRYQVTGTHHGKNLQWAFAQFGIEGTPRIAMDSLDAIYRVLSSRRHPDRVGGSEHAMSDLNVARTMIVEKAIWVR